MQRVIIILSLIILFSSCSQIQYHWEKEEFYCNIKFFDAIYLQKPTDCKSPYPLMDVYQGDTTYFSSIGYEEGLEVAAYLDKASGYNSKSSRCFIKVGCEVPTAHCLSKAEYLQDRAVWIEKFEAKRGW